MTRHSVCVIHKDVCAACGSPVLGGSDNGTLAVPTDGQVAVCLLCRLLGRDRDGDMEEGEA